MKFYNNRKNCIQFKIVLKHTATSNFRFAEHEIAQRQEYPNLSDEEYAKQRLKVGISWENRSMSSVAIIF